MVLAAIILTVCIAIETLEQILYRLASRLSTVARMTFISFGVGLHLLGLAFWFWVIKMLPLGIVLPLMSLSYITIGFASWLIFKESLSPKRWAAIILITLGAALVWSGK